MSFTALQDKLHIKGHLVSAEHMNAQGKAPLATRYTIKNRFSKGFRYIVAKSNDWWQVQARDVLAAVCASGARKHE